MYGKQNSSFRSGTFTGHTLASVPLVNSCVSQFCSDNGTNFTGAETKLKRAIAELNNGTIEKLLLHNDIKWSVNTSTDSHYGVLGKA